jgi:hypothetical protein
VLPERLLAILGRVRLRLRLRAVAHAVTMAAAVCGALMAMSMPAAAAAGIALVIAVIAGVRLWRIEAGTVARTIEAHHPLDNLLITAAELDERPRPTRPDIRDAILQQASDRIAAVNPAGVVPLAQPVAVATAVTLACILLSRVGGVATLLPAGGIDPPAARTASNAITVTVTPPAYTKRAAEAHANPVQLTVLAGSRVRIEGAAGVIREWDATASESLDLQVHDAAPSRFLAVTVIPDAPPVVRVIEPGRDSAFAAPDVLLRIGVDSRDDLGLATLALRYTKASGGGENVTFTEGEIPLTVERASEQHWQARAEWRLNGLGLTDGDVLVYRAIARDRNPNGTPVESDAFLVEIGRTAEIASAGFALPTEEKKYAISQQMVIYKTEQLIRLRQGSGETRFARPEDWLEQTRAIAVEQRMVRAEVVFLSGGEVQDEVEEAAHSHELAEGRLENQGRAEMVRALSFMSRAEAQLNDGNAREALVFERQALASLERALDRRRYFLRTLPDRSRIDLTRRLSGERAEARSWTRDRTRTEPPVADAARALMRELAAAAAGTRTLDASLAARIAAIDPQSAPLQQAAVAIASARARDQRHDAVAMAMEAVIAHALAAAPAAAPVYLRRDPLAGRLADETARPRR